MPPDFLYEWPEWGMFLFILGVTALTAVTIHGVFATSPLKRLSTRVADLSPTVPALCGTLFVLSVTFLANSVWQSEQRAREAVNEEARSLRIIRTYAGAMVSTSQDTLSGMIADYGRAVNREWPIMGHAGGSAGSETILATLYSAAILGLSEGEHNRLLQQRIVAALDALSAARQQRLSMARDVVSGGQWFMVAALAILLIVVMSLAHGRFTEARLAVLAALSLAISIALFVILAHDRPFVGNLAVTPHAIIDAASPGPPR